MDTSAIHGLTVRPGHSISIMTHQGRWRVVSHDDGRLEVLEFHPHATAGGASEVASELASIGSSVENRIIQRDGSLQDTTGKSIMEKAASWIKAETSLIMRGALSDEDYESRIAVCKSCDQLEAMPDPSVGFCKACGCGKNPRAELTVKGRMPAATCPKGKWPALPAK